MHTSLWATRAGCGWNPESAWLRSGEQTHEPLVDAELFEAVQERFRRGAHRTGSRKPRTTLHPYALRGLVHCGLCGRRMEGTWNNDRPYYRCRFPKEYALVNRIDHPGSVYLPEHAVTAPLDRWLAELFDSSRLEGTIDALARAADQECSPKDASMAEARRVLAETETQLARYRAACDAGADPAIVAGWIVETQARRAQAEQVLREPRHQRRRMTRDEIAALLATLGEAWTRLQEADPADKAEVYRHLGLGLTYEPENKLVEVKVGCQAWSSRGAP